MYGRKVHDAKPICVCEAFIREANETEGAEIITVPNYVLGESLNEVQVIDELTTGQKRDVFRKDGSGKIQLIVYVNHIEQHSASQKSAKFYSICNICIVMDWRAC